MPLRVLHCLNQFFAGLGGEERADLQPVLLDGARGPGRLLESLSPEIEIAQTLAFGDNYVASDLDRALTEVIGLIERSAAGTDLVIAGPAFGAGRYGLACGAICAAVSEQLGIPSLTAMHPENPGVDAYRRRVVIVPASADVMGMSEAVEGLVRVGLRLAAGAELTPESDGTLPQGRRRNVFAPATGAERAVDMLLAKLAGREFATEYRMPVFDRVPPAEPIAAAARSRIGLVTSGGIVPRGNPDHIESANAHTFGEYSIEGLTALAAPDFTTVHGGYDPTFARADPNRVLPLDVARELEGEGRIGRLHDRYYATVGNATSVERAQAFGREIALRLQEAGVQAVILTST